MEPRPLEPPVLEDELVRVRPLRDDDAPAYAQAFRDDPELGRLGGWETDPDEHWLRGHLPVIAERARLGSGSQLAIAMPDDDRVVGDLVLHHVDWRHETTEIGFWLAVGVRGAGRATAATRLLLRWTFAEAGLHRIEIKTLPENAGALGLAERLGFTREARLRDCAVERGVRVSLELWSLLATDPAARRL